MCYICIDAVLLVVVMNELTTPHHLKNIKNIEKCHLLRKMSKGIEAWIAFDNIKIVKGGDGWGYVGCGGNVGK